MRCCLIAIEHARNDKGLTREDLAERIRKSERYVVAIERGERTPSLKTFYQIVRCLGISVDKLFYPEATLDENSATRELPAWLPPVHRSSFGSIEKCRYLHRRVLASEKPYEPVYKFCSPARSCMQTNSTPSPHTAPVAARNAPVWTHPQCIGVVLVQPNIALKSPLSGDFYSLRLVYRITHGGVAGTEVGRY